VLDRTVDLLEGVNAALTGHVWVKPIGQSLQSSRYALAIATMSGDFQSQLAAANTSGIVILDARTKTKNVPNVHAITTRKFRASGDPFPLIAESPVFGHSDSHVGLQVADLVASALLFPLACFAYCDDLQWNTHVHPAYEKVRDRYSSRLLALEHRYLASNGSRRGGIVVSDLRNHRPSLALFGPLARTRPHLNPAPPSASSAP
jgi:hypothetical protein